MTTTELTVEYLRTILEYDAETGVFRWKAVRGNVPAGSVAGRFDRDGYREISIDGRTYRAHRLAWFMTFEEWPQHFIDHIDGDPLNNRIANLRDVTNSVNQLNRKGVPRNNTSGFIGVVRCGSKRLPWVAQIRNHKKTFYLGCFQTAEQAHAAYLDAKRRLSEGRQPLPAPPSEGEVKP